MTWIAVAALAAASAAVQPRPELLETRLAGGAEAALAETERLLVIEPENAHELGVDYLRGRLLTELGRTQEAYDAFLEALNHTPSLRLYSYYRLALSQERLGHPEMAAGLVAYPVARGASFREVAEAARLLRRVLNQGGDCRVLNGIQEAAFPDGERRQIRLARAECALRAGDSDRGGELLVEILDERTDDEAALEAADLAAGAMARSGDSAVLVSIGMVLHQHREFDRSAAFLREANTVPEGTSRLSREEFEIAYAQVRNDFWRRRYASAIGRYGQLAERAPTPELAAQARYQQGRSLELAGEWKGAAQAFRTAHAADPDGEWAGPALLAAMRLDWRSFNEGEALALFERLSERRGWRELLARAALFLTASDLVRGRSERAGDWLARADATGEVPVPELAYWQGRLAELQGNLPAAAAAFVEALEADPYHPLSQAARGRLRTGPAAAAARAEGVRLAGSPRRADLRRAWLLLGDEHPRGRAALNALASALRRDRSAGVFLTLGPRPVESWPLWSSEIQDSDELLLSLGLWDEGAPAVDRHFPLSEPDLALTGSLLLAREGLTRRALYRVEVLAQRLPPDLPERLLPEAFRKSLYPLPYRDLLLAEAGGRGVDPLMLAALVREESRFDPTALSSASARGLAQLTHPAAQRFAAAAGRERIAPEELYRPEVALALGAAYVAELLRFSGGAPHVAVAAYNAGEDQARLWHSYCFSRDPAEYFTKVSFGQTRAYLRKVLASWAQYREIYGSLETAP